MAIKLRMMGHKRAGRRGESIVAAAMAKRRASTVRDSIEPTDLRKATPAVSLKRLGGARPSVKGKIFKRLRSNLRMQPGQKGGAISQPDRTHMAVPGGETPLTGVGSVFIRPITGRTSVRVRAEASHSPTAQPSRDQQSVGGRPPPPGQLRNPYAARFRLSSNLDARQVGGGIPPSRGVKFW